MQNTAFEHRRDLTHSESGLFFSPFILLIMNIPPEQATITSVHYVLSSAAVVHSRHKAFPIYALCERVHIRYTVGCIISVRR